MTREDAVKHFESYIGNECYTDFHQDACQMAIAALRSQQIPTKLDRSRWPGCRNCNNPNFEIIFGFPFCPACGKPQSEAAWADLEQRIGGNNGKTD